MGCKALMEVVVPDKVTSIGKEAFGGCTSLSKITMPETITEIGESAFSGCSMLERFKVPESTVAVQIIRFTDAQNCPLLQFLKICL